MMRACFNNPRLSLKGEVMAVWKYARNKEVTGDEISKILSSLTCFNCGKDLHSDDCPFAKLRAELKALETISETEKKGD